MKQLTPLRRTRKFSGLLITLLFACFALSQRAQGVVPPPDGGYTGGNTAEGQNALLSLTTGGFNTGIGILSLRSNTTGSFNTAVGAGTLLANTGDGNTAVGTAALLSDTTGFFNTASGSSALLSNTIGFQNTANGIAALFSNTTGIDNTATGAAALHDNQSGGSNTATGFQALAQNTAGFNTATGSDSLINNTTGHHNTANGVDTLHFNTTGNNNVALGNGAGAVLTTGSDNIDIGNGGNAGESSTIRIGVQTPPVQTATYIAGISGTAVVGDTVVVDGNGQLGTVASAARFKKEIKPMDKTSEAILALKPVSFQYKSDSKGKPQFGLIADEVAKVNSDLVVRDRKGEIYSVRYDAVNAMLLNEFLKEHRKVEEQNGKLENQARKIQEQEATMTQLKKDFGATTAQQQKQIDALTVGLQKVSAQLEASKPAPQVVNNP
jgi:hypothetical protein